MNHPPKKKNKNPLLPEDSQVDERHLINTEDSAVLSFEEKITLYWNENKGFLTGCILVLLLTIVGYQGIRIFKASVDAKIQSEYAQAEADGTLSNFARAHSDDPLGGFAALSVADEAYTAKDYEKALEYYTLIISSSVETIPLLDGRAHLGQAFALYNNGQVEEGLAKLNTIAIDSSLPEGIRAEAAYHLAIEAHTAGNSEAFASYAKQVEDSEFAEQWQQRLNFLPELAK